MISLGIDLGGTQIKYGLVKDGKILHYGSCDTELKEGYRAVVRRMADCAKSFLQGAQVEFVGIASPGLVDAHKGVVRYSNNFGWRDVPLAKDLSACLGLPTRIANDAHCAALGEALYGAGKGVERMAMLTIGTGVGGGFVRNGRLETDGYGSMAYVFGHCVIAHDGKLCNCGQRGCLETYASATAIARRGEQVFEGQKSVRQIFELARAGDAVAQGVLREFLEVLTVGVVNVANILRPQVIVLGGGVSASGDLIVSAVNQGLEKYVYGYEYAPVRAVCAQLENRAGIVGAANLTERQK